VELIIAEKPSVARDIARVLGVRPSASAQGEHFESDRYAITWCIGHLVELDEPASYDAAWKPWRLDVLPMLPTEFRLRGSKHATKQLRVVAKLLKDRRFDSVINACDAGREGELIFRYVYQHAKSRLPMRRLWISSLTDEAIRRGFATVKPAREYDALADAARSRSEADWLVGMNATRAITVRARSSGADQLLSIGRVQTPTLALITAREQEIRAFVPKAYWEVQGTFDRAFTANYRSDKLTRIAAPEISEAVVARDTAAPTAEVVDLRQKTVREAPPQLFDLTSLQRTANRRFGFSAARTLEIAQALYERHKLVTYPRTDSRHLSSDIARELPDTFRALSRHADYGAFAQRLADAPPRPNGRIVDDAKVHDHHAIIPTPSSQRMLDRDEARLYDLIVRRFLGAFYPDAEIAVTEAWLRVGSTLAGGPIPAFSVADREKYIDALPPPPDHYLARGRVRLVAGWQEVAGFDPATSKKPSDDGKEDDTPTAALPPLQIGQRLTGTYKSLAKQTTPPPRYTEATLLAAMESAGKSIDDEALRAAMKDVGLGTPATRAAIIETLLRRNYIARDRQQLIPTEMGLALIRFLVDTMVGSLASPELTGNWEARLARIARHEDTRAAFMADIARYVTDVITAIRGGSPPTAMSPAPMSPAPMSPAPMSPASLSPASLSPASLSPASLSPASPFPSTPRSNYSKVRKPQRAARTAKAPSAKPKGARASAKAPSAKPKGARALAKAPSAKPKVSRALAKAPSTKPKGARASTKATSQVDIRSLRCPRCKIGHLMTGQRGWGCERWKEGCKFVVWFETDGRRITEQQLARFVTTGAFS
jgi:DNA topoisomerase-3